MNTWNWYRKETMQECLVSLSALVVWVLSWVYFKWWLCTTHLGVSHPPSGVTPSPLLSFSYLFIFYFLPLRHFHLSFVWCSLSLSFNLVSILSYSSLSILIFAPHRNFHLLLYFSLCSLEENLHTYLTTLLSSYLVTIFIESHLILLN